MDEDRCAEVEADKGVAGTGMAVGVGLGLSLFLRRTSWYEGLALPHLALDSGSFWDLVSSCLGTV